MYVGELIDLNPKIYGFVTVDRPEMGSKTKLWNFGKDPPLWLDNYWKQIAPVSIRHSGKMWPTRRLLDLQPIELGC